MNWAFGSKRKHTPAEAQAMADRYVAGENFEQIATSVGAGASTVRLRIREILGTHRPYRFGRATDTQRATRQHTLRDLAWAAGFLEGEGSFRRTSGEHGSERVTFAQVNRAPVDQMIALLGGRAKQRHRGCERHSAVWDWAIYGARARGVMLTLYPLMSPKRQSQIRAALLK